MKAGIKTSEFWLGLLGVVLPYLNESLELGLDTPAIVAAITSIVAYIIGRSIVKIANSKK